MAGNLARSSAVATASWSGTNNVIDPSNKRTYVKRDK
jgi:hypothetical protein